MPKFSSSLIPRSKGIFQASSCPVDAACTHTDGRYLLKFKHLFKFEASYMKHNKTALSKQILDKSSNYTNGNYTNSCFFVRTFIASNTRQIHSTVHSNLSAVLKFFAGQCNAIAAQKLRRGIQISNLYCKLYDEHSVQRVAKQWTSMLQKRLKSKPIMLAVGALFSWEHERVTDDELKWIRNLLNDALPSESPSSRKEPSHGTKNTVGSASKLCEKSATSVSSLDWELLIDKPLVKVWRRPVPDSHLYQYRVYGAYSDISAKAFYNVQVDLKYRRQWDKLVIKLDLIDRDEQTGCEVVHWITHFPFPMRSREYVYVRRQEMDAASGTMVMTARAVHHPALPEAKDSVRVHQYESSMLIRAKRSVDQNGLEYVMTYFDDPRSSFPSAAYNWLASTGVPDFVDKIHDAAKRLQDQESLCVRQLETDAAQSQLETAFHSEAAYQ